MELKRKQQEEERKRREEEERRIQVRYTTHQDDTVPNLTPRIRLKSYLCFSA